MEEMKAKWIKNGKIKYVADNNNMCSWAWKAYEIGNEICYEEYMKIIMAKIERRKRKQW